jgi:DNA-binding NarL/FixJ family response regulator
VTSQVAKPRTIIADDYEPIRALLRQLIEPSCEVVFEASDGPETIAAVERLQPELLLLDISMPGMNGFEVLRRVKKELPEIQVIIVSEHRDPTYTDEAFRLGAAGYVSKRTALHDLAECVERVIAR